MTRRTPMPRRARGFSLIEVLIAVLVLAIGLLGFALLQTTGLKYSQSANYRTLATNLAGDLLDQMRANRLSAASYTSATFAAGTVSGAGCSRPIAAGVTVAQSVARWQCQVVAALGEDAGANVTFADGVATVTITWGERFTGADASTTFQTRTQL